MENEHSCQAGTNTNNGRHGDGQDQHAGKAAPPLGVEYSISPDVPCPKTVLVAVMTDGSYLLMAYPQREPAAFVTRDDAGPLRQALVEAFWSPSGEAATGNGNGK